MKVKDLMVPLHGYLRPDDTLVEACRMMKETRRSDSRVGVRALPVLDDDEGQTLVGIVSMGDILKAVMPSYLAMTDLGAFTWDGMVEEIARKVTKKRISEIMTREVVTVPEDSALMHAIEYMLTKGVKRLPVLSRSGRVVGMIYERDIFNALTGMIGEGGKEGGR